VAIKNLELVSFRNHKNRKFRFNKGLTVIWGENGSGKTSILEAIHLLSYGRSFRTRKQKDMINYTDNDLIARGEFFLENRKDEISALISKNKKQQIKLNGKKTAGRKDIIGRNNVVVLSPEEQALTKGAPVERRNFFDKLFSTISPNYLNCLQVYTKTLKQRNAVIESVKKNRNPIGDIESWDEQIVKCGTELWKQRYKYIIDFSSCFKSVSNMYNPSLKISINYLRASPTKDDYRELLKNSRHKDIVLGRTTTGPHRDDVIIKWCGKSLRQFGSQGEHKISLVLLKLSEMLFIKEKTSKTPTLLLDDLFAKLDMERSKKIVTLLHGFENKPCQTVVTTTDLYNIEKIGLIKNGENHSTIHIEK